MSDHGVRKIVAAPILRVLVQVAVANARSVEQRESKRIVRGFVRSELAVLENRHAVFTRFVGQVEPWSAGSYYVLALLGSGIVSGAFIPRHLGILYVSVVVGQIVYTYMIHHSSVLAGMGLGTLLLYTLIFLGGAVFGARLQRIF